MLDDLRNSATSSYLDEEEMQQQDLRIGQDNPQEKLLLGMTAPQRFVIVLMMLMMTCVLGAFFLVATEKIILPFL